MAPRDFDLGMKQFFPKFSKGVRSYATNSEASGVRYTPEARRLALKLLGEETEEHRKDSEHISCWLSEGRYFKIALLMCENRWNLKQTIEHLIDAYEVET